MKSVNGQIFDLVIFYSYHTFNFLISISYFLSKRLYLSHTQPKTNFTYLKSFLMVFRPAAFFNSCFTFLSALCTASVHAVPSVAREFLTTFMYSTRKSLSVKVVSMNSGQVKSYNMLLQSIGKKPNQNKHTFER